MPSKSEHDTQNEDSMAVETNGDDTQHNVKLEGGHKRKEKKEKKEQKEKKKEKPKIVKDSNSISKQKRKEPKEKKKEPKVKTTESEDNAPKKPKKRVDNLEKPDDQIFFEATFNRLIRDRFMKFSGGRKTKKGQPYRMGKDSLLLLRQLTLLMFKDIVSDASRICKVGGHKDLQNKYIQSSFHHLNPRLSQLLTV